MMQETRVSFKRESDEQLEYCSSNLIAQMRPNESDNTNECGKHKPPDAMLL